MKKKFTILSIVLFLGGLNTVNAQLNLIPTSVCKEIKAGGWVYFYENTLNTGELFTTYNYCFFPQGSNNIWELDKEWDDNQLNFHHKLYQQTFNGIKVEGSQFTEHGTQAGKVVYAHGKICSQIETRYVEETIDETIALKAVINHYSNSLFAWEVEEVEAQLILDSGDTTATNYPTGELVFALNDFAPIQYDYNPSDFRMAWRFEVRSIQPDFHNEVYVDAVTGEVFKENTLYHYDGTATIPHNGAVTLDTRYLSGFTNAHVLHTNDNGRDVHTKDFETGGTFGTMNNYEDTDAVWGTSNVKGTSAHWGVTKTWDYFKDVFDRDGLDDNGGKVRVFANWQGEGSRYIHGVFGIDRVYYGTSSDGVYNGELSVCAHEFAHGVSYRSGAKLYYGNESGALDESFADIFGILVKQHTTGSIDWVFGVPNSITKFKRSLQSPSSFGFNFDVTTSPFTENTGQPDTYEGDFWFPYSQYGNDFGGVHINSGVQNHWFYMLSMGETGTNDLGDSYTVNGVGIDIAAQITYYNLINNMQKNSTYEDAKNGAIEYALEQYGECSFEHIETQNAWYASGLGSWSTCEGAGINEGSLKFDYYPNPATDNINISFNDIENKTIEIYNTNGQLIRKLKNVESGKYTINISDFANGTYILSVIGETNVQRIKFVKH